MSGERKKILVVDDDPDILEQVAHILRSDGYEVVTAPGQAEAEALLADMRPDLALLDLMMEHMDSGFVLCHLVKRLYPGTPVILLTAVTADTGLEFEASSASARAWVKAETFLDKPVRAEQLRAEVKRLLHG